MAMRTLTQRVLLPLDGSELATVSVPYARALATADTELVLCRIVPDPTPLMELAGTSAYPVERIRKSRLAEVDAYLDAVAEVLRDITPNVSTVSGVGEPPDEILRIAEERGIDLIVMASHGRGFLGRVLVGSVGDRVARAASVPVMLIHPQNDAGVPHTDDTARIGRFVVPLDGSQRAREALPVAARLARQLGLGLFLVTAIPTREEMTADDEEDDTGFEFHETYRAALSDALCREATGLTVPGVTTAAEVVVGPAADGILQVLAEDDVVVMASHGHGGVRRWLLGSVAERIIHSGKAPVILVPVIERNQAAEDIS